MNENRLSGPLNRYFISISNYDWDKLHKECDKDIFPYAYTLYSFYMRHANYQGTFCPYVTTSFARNEKGLGFSQTKFLEAKRKLLELGFIEDKIVKQEENLYDKKGNITKRKGQINKHYIKLTSKIKETLDYNENEKEEENRGKSDKNPIIRKFHHCTDSPYSGVCHTMVNDTTNTSNTKLNTSLNTKEKNTYSKSLRVKTEIFEKNTKQIVDLWNECASHIKKEICKIPEVQEKFKNNDGGIHLQSVRKINKEIKEIIEIAIENSGGIEYLEESILNYVSVLADPDCWYTYCFKLRQFLEERSRGYGENKKGKWFAFHPDEFNINEYKRNSNKNIPIGERISNGPPPRSDNHPEISSSLENDFKRFFNPEYESNDNDKQKFIDASYRLVEFCKKNHIYSHEGCIHVLRRVLLKQANEGKTIFPGTYKSDYVWNTLMFQRVRYGA